MKKFKTLLALTLALVLIVGVIPVQAATIKLSKSKATIEVGETLTLTLKNASEGTIKWTSSNKNVATVKASKNGKAKVKAVAEGTTVIKAKYDGETYKCTVTVEYPTIDWTVTFGEWIDDTQKVSWYDKEGEYAGELVDNIPNGYGRFDTENSSGMEYYYLGNFENGQPNGLGYMKWLDNNQFFYGNFDNGLYNPTFGQVVLTVLGWRSEPLFGIVDMTIECADFVDECSALSSKKIKKIAESIELKKLTKNITAYNECVDYVSTAYIVDCYEDVFGGHTFTYILAYNTASEGIYQLVYDGTLDVYVGDFIDFYGTPVSNIAFDNVSGGTTRAVYEVAYVIEKVE